MNDAELELQFFFNSLTPHTADAVQAEDGSWVSPSFYDNPKTTAAGTTTASPLVAEFWPQLAALASTLNALSQGVTVPVNFRPDAQTLTAAAAFIDALRLQMYLAAL